MILTTLLLGFAGFVFVFVFKHRKVGLIAAGGDKMVLDGFQNSTAWLVGVSTIGKLALFGKLEDFLEITG